MRSLYGFVRRSPPFRVLLMFDVFAFFCLDFVLEGSSGGKLPRLAMDFYNRGVSPFTEGDESSLVWSSSTLTKERLS